MVSSVVTGSFPLIYLCDDDKQIVYYICKFLKFLLKIPGYIVLNSFKFFLGPSQLSRDVLLLPFVPPKGDLAMYPKAVSFSSLLQTSQAHKGPFSRQCIPSQLNKGHYNVCPSKKYRLVSLLCCVLKWYFNPKHNSFLGGISKLC